VSALECLHYALNLPTLTVITRIETLERFDYAFSAALTSKPMNQAQINKLYEKVQNKHFPRAQTNRMLICGSFSFLLQLQSKKKAFSY